MGLMGLNGIKDFEDPGSFDIFRLARAADRQTVGIYRSSLLLLRCRIELCALWGASHPPCSELRSSLPNWDGARSIGVCGGGLRVSTISFIRL